jgi:hypothetical protein
MAGRTRISWMGSLVSGIALALVEIQEKPPWWVAPLLVVALVVFGLLWLLSLGQWVRERWAKNLHKNAEGSGNIVVNAPVATAFGVALETQVIRHNPWTARYTDQLHGLFPTTNGVFVFLHYDRDHADGHFRCRVTHDDRRYEAEGNASLGPKKPTLGFIYPGQFAGAGGLPIDNGDYRVVWEMEDGLGWKFLDETTFRMVNGQLE